MDSDSGISDGSIMGVGLPAKLRHRIAAASFFFLLGCGFSCWASRIADIRAAMGLSDDMLGMVLFAIPVGTFFGMSFSGYVVTRFGSRNVLTAAAILYPTALACLGLVAEVWQLCLGLFFFGICGNLCNISINTQAVGVEKIYGRSIMATFHGVWSLAGFLGGVLSIRIVSAGVTVFWHFMMLYALAVILLILMRRHLLAEDPPVPNAAAASERRRRIFRPDAYIATLGFIAFCCMACEGTMFDWSVIYFQDIVKAPKGWQIYGFAAFMCAMAAGRFTADRLVTRFGPIRVIQASGLVIASGLSTAVALPYFAPSCFGFALVGFGVSSIVPLCYSLAGRSRTMSTGAALTGVSSIGFFGFLMGPPVIGFVSEALSLRWSFTLILFVGLTATFLAPRLKRLNAGAAQGAAEAPAGE